MFSSTRKYHEVISLLLETRAHLCELQHSQQQVLHVMLVIIEMHGPTAAMLPARLHTIKPVKNSSTPEADLNAYPY